MSPGHLGENPSAECGSPCDLPPASSPSYSLNHTSFLSALGTCQTLARFRAFACALSSALDALHSPVLPVLLCPWDDGFSLVLLCSESHCGSPLPQPPACSGSRLTALRLPIILTIPSLVPFYLSLLSPNPGQVLSLFVLQGITFSKLLLAVRAPGCSAGSPVSFRFLAQNWLRATSGPAGTLEPP